LIPIHPITEESTLEDCAKIALDIGKELVTSHSELSVFYFGHADLEFKRDLVCRRKELGWFENRKGPPLSKNTKHGLTGIGAIPMSNFNVMIECDEIEIGNDIAKKIRQRNGGLLGVQAMAFHHGENQIEIACNVDMVFYDETNSKHKKECENGRFVQSMGNYFVTPFEVIENEIKEKAKLQGVSVCGDSVIIGFTPLEAGNITKECLISGSNWVVERYTQTLHM